MKLLLDTCVWGGARGELEAAGHDAVWTGEEDDPGDEEILARALREDRVLVTLDKDFGELAVRAGRPHGGIVRLVHVSARKQASVLLHVLAGHADELERGAIVTAEPGRVRVRVRDH